MERIRYTFTPQYMIEDSEEYSRYEHIVCEMLRHVITNVVNEMVEEEGNIDNYLKERAIKNVMKMFDEVRLIKLEKDIG